MVVEYCCWWLWYVEKNDDFVFGERVCRVFWKVRRVLYFGYIVIVFDVRKEVFIYYVCIECFCDVVDDL